MAAETGFLIDGTVYEVPTLDSLTMSERRVMFELAGVTQEDFVQAEDETDEEREERIAKLTRHPGFMEALMHVAYQRGNPTLKAAKVRLVVEATNYLEAVEAMVADDEEPEADAVPLALTTPPDESSQSDSSDSNSSSEQTTGSGGSDSTTGSEGLVRVPTRIGTGRSDTSSPASPRTESVA